MIFLQRIRKDPVFLSSAGSGWGQDRFRLKRSRHVAFILQEIQYRVYALRQGLSRRLFEASIDVADQRERLPGFAFCPNGERSLSIWAR
jgi:hypothetical protein